MGYIKRQVELQEVETEIEVDFQIGDRFSTGNEHINQMDPGTILLVTGGGWFEVVDLPQVEINPGDRINTKYGPATAVRLSSRPLNKDVIYVADSDPVVRSAWREKVEPIEDPLW